MFKSFNETLKTMQKGVHLITILLLCFVVIHSCKNSTTVNQPTQTPEKTTLNTWVKPSSYIQGVPIYDTFSDIEPLFHLDTDTTYFINFWATWCKPCVEELPYFEAFTEQYKNQKVKVILVSLDFPKKIETKLIPFLEKHQLKSEVVVLKDGKFNNWIDKVSPKWDGSIPVTYIYKGNQTHFISGSIDNQKDLENAYLGMK